MSTIIGMIVGGITFIYATWRWPNDSRKQFGFIAVVAVLVGLTGFFGTLLTQT